MRRIAKLKAKEVSMTVEGANRRVIAAYKSAVKPDAIKSNSQGDTMDIQSLISNTDPAVMSAIAELAKSANGPKGKGYTPQAASIIKAVGRLLAPFAGELTLADLQAVGKAAGLGSSTAAASDAETAPAFKSKAAKAKDDEVEGEEDEDDASEGTSPGTSMDFNAGESDDSDDSDDAKDEDEDGDSDKAPKTKDAKKSAKSANVALKSKKDDNSDKPFPGAAKPFGKKGKDDDEEDEDVKDDSKETGQPNGSKAKEKTVSKSAIGSNADDSRYEEIMKSHREQLEINKALQEQVAKTRKDLDDERNYRALESIKKSVRSDFAHLNVDADALAPVLKSLKDADDQGPFEQLTAILKAADKQVKGAQEASGIFTQIGKSSASAPQGGASWEQRIEARVDELVAKDSTKHRAVHYDEFTQTPEGRDMLRNYRNERGV